MSERFHQWGTLLATGIGALFVGIDFTIVNTVLANIQAALHTSMAELQWVMAGFALTFCTLLVTMGRLGDLIGRRLLLYVGVIGFILSSVGSGLSHTAIQLIVCRILQGLFSAIIFPCGMALTSKAFPRDQQGKAVGLYSSVLGIGFAIGPVLGGFLVSIANWRWIFLINFPVGILSLIICFLAVSESRSEKKEMIDWWGMSFLIIALSTAVFAIMQGISLGWGSLPIVSCLVVAIISTLLFVKIEFKVKHPLIPFHALANRGFLIGVLIFIATLGFSWTVTFFAPLYLQTIMGFTPSKTGWIFLIMTIMTFVTPGFAGSIYDKHGRKFSSYIVLITAVLSFALMLFFNIHGPLWLVILAFIAYGFSWGVANGVAMPIALSEQKNHDDTAVISGAVCTIFNFFGILFFSLVGIFFSSAQLGSKLGFISAFHMTALIMLGLAVVFAVMTGWFLKNPT